MGAEGVELEGVEEALGVLKAPVLAFCSCSNISCSSFGRRGGEGAVLKGEAAPWRGVVLRARRERARAERRRERETDGRIADFERWKRGGLVSEFGGECGVD